jgi:hypothetical protein
MSSACSFCNKPYKSRNALIKHSAKCSARTENITSDIVEPEEVEPAVSDHDEASRTRQRLSDDFTEHARCDFKEQLLALSLQSRTSDENILVDAKAFDTLTRAFIGELFSYQHSQLKTIVGHNHVLAEENKMLISVLRSIVLMKHKDGSLGEYDFSSDEEEDASKTT